MHEKLPNIFLFNPACEYAVANENKYWQPNSILQKMETDLSLLPLYLAKANDVVLVRKEISADFMESMQRLIPVPPEIKLLKKALNNHQFINQPKNSLMPWGWSPATHQLLSPFKPSCSTEFNASPVANWQPQSKQLYSKKFALDILEKILSSTNSDILLPKTLMPVVCTGKNDFENLLNRWDKIMVKAPWSASGRGLQPITKTPVHPKVWEKLLGIVKAQGYAITEPFHDKVLDLAFQFKIKKGSIHYLGTSFFSTDKKGQYQKSYLNGLPEETGPGLLEFVKNAEKLIAPVLINEIGQSLIAKNYEGWFGVDSLIFKDNNAQLKINPCLEINLRQNMGLLSLKLQHYLPADKKGILSLYYRPGISFKAFAEKMEQDHPLKIFENKLESGFFPLTPTTNDADFGAYLLA